MGFKGTKTDWTKMTVNETMTKIMIERIEKRRAEGHNVAPWRMTWDPSLGMPRNLLTGHAYRGVNIFMTLFQGYATPFWITRNQVRKLGGKIKKLTDGSTVIDRDGNEVAASEPYTPIIFWKFPTEEEAEEGRRAYCRFYRLWNVEQVNGINLEVEEAFAGINIEPKEPIEAAEALVAGYPGAPEIKHGDSRAYYAPGFDRVSMPNIEAFESAEAYYRVLFHELTHSTGHRTRLERDGVANPSAFASHAYSEEELIAEMGASMLAGFAGIGSEEADDNSAAYLDHWLRKLKADPNLLVTAGGAAQKAIDHIRNIKWEKAETTEEKAKAA
jgi:antirestriction protein ArdC